MSQDEELILNLRPHWWEFAQPAAILVGALVLAVVLTLLDVTVLMWIGWGIFLLALANGARHYGIWVTTYFVVTSERLITRSGVLSKRGVEIPLDRINNVNFEQSIFERLIQAGDLLIESAGESGQSRFSNVRKPDAVQNTILTAMDDQRTRIHGGGRAAPQPAPAAPSIPDQISQLDELRQRRVITEAEFEAKKAELLRRM